MRIDLNKRVISLEPGRPLAIGRAKGVLVECVTGSLWLTVAGFSGDVFLAPGQRWQVPTDGLVVIEAIQAGMMRLHCPVSIGARVLRGLTSAASGLRIQTNV